MSTSESMHLFPTGKPAGNKAPKAIVVLALSGEDAPIPNESRLRGLLTQGHPSTAEDPQHKIIKIYTLGRFGIMVKGRLIRFTGKARRKPLELLKALIALGGREVPEEQLSDALWPEADGDAAQRALTTTLHRLRQLLGTKNALHLRERRLTLVADYCWVDVWAFERLLGRIDGICRDIEGQTRSSLLANAHALSRLTENAVRLYQGHFLGRESGEAFWAVSLRERLRAKLVCHIGAAAQYLCRGEQCRQALRYYEKGLEVDDLAEEFYIGSMRCYQCLGRHADTAKTYHRCRRTLEAQLGVEPSSETQDIYRHSQQTGNTRTEEAALAG